MKSKHFYLAKIKDNAYLNYLSLSSCTPLRLKDTCIKRESIYYTKSEIQEILKIHPNVIIEVVQTWI